MLKTTAISQFIKRFRFRDYSCFNLDPERCRLSAMVKVKDSRKDIHLYSVDDRRKENKKNQKYEDAIEHLNSLLNNAQTIQNTLRGDPGVERRRFEDTAMYLNRTGMTLEQLDQLPVIHVSGTKGKGSTCSIVESILREHGLKTGFFSSPHLMEVTERFRLNGEPISRKMFAEYFWKIYPQLHQKKQSEHEMPPFFKFLSLMAYHLFLDQKVDVAIIEVGIGGEFDCTNIVRNTRTVGITSLGLDHVQILGDTIRKIAWQKAGIIKPNSHVFTVRQLEDGEEVIRNRAKEKQASVSVVPAYEEYTWSRPPELSVDTDIHKINASLAIQLAYDWLIQTGRIDSKQDLLHCTETVILGLERFNWPGRYQIVERANKTFYLDGAHTVESIEGCVKWFKKATFQSNSEKCLILYITGQRNIERLLKPIVEDLCLEKVIISPFVVATKPLITDSTIINTAELECLAKCKQIASVFNETQSSKRSSSVQTKAVVVSSVSEAIGSLSSPDKQYDVLITGSLYLIGAALTFLKENE